MKVVDPRTAIEVIPTDECLRLLAGESVGRLAVVRGGQPHVIPVNYALDEGTVLFRSAPGTKLEGALHAPVAFEVDKFDGDTRSGWSVVVHGRADEVTAADRPDVVARVSTRVIDPWTDFDKQHLVRIVPTQITGRRVAGHSSPA